MGDLQRCLATGEYGLLKDCPLFESNFMQGVLSHTGEKKDPLTQVTKTGDIANRVTVGIAATSPSLELPDLMLLARPGSCLTGQYQCECPNPEASPGPDDELQLFGLLPLKFVRIYIHDETRYQLKIRLANGRTFYLQLLAHPLKQEHVFGQWVRLLYRLRFHQSDAPVAYEQVNNQQSRRPSRH